MDQEPAEPDGDGAEARRLPHRRDHHVMAALVLLVGILTLLFGEHIPANGGRGYDGKDYVRIALEPSVALFERPPDIHRGQRMLPSLIVSGALRGVGAPLTKESVIAGFALFNTALLVACCYLWASLARRLGLRPSIRWLGFCGLFVNYAIAKFAGYYPTLTDVAGFTLGMAVVWAFVVRRRATLLITSMVATFAWPTVAYQGLLLETFSRGEALTGETRPHDRRRSLILAAVVAVVVCLRAVTLFSCQTACLSDVIVHQTIEPLVPLSLAIVAVYLFLATRPIFERLLVRDALRTMNVRWLVLGLLAIATLWWFQGNLFRESDATLTRTLNNISREGIAKPALFAVGHITFLGPMVVLAALSWRRVVAAASRLGPAMLLMLLAGAVLGISSEARKLINFWPVIVILTAVAVNELDWRWKQTAMFGGVSLLASRVWFPLNHGPLQMNYRQYPDQLYFMSMGPRMTPVSYAIMLAFSLVIVALTYAIWRSMRANVAGPVPRPVDAPEHVEESVMPAAPAADSRDRV